MNHLYKLRYLDFVETDKDIWFPNLNFNALIKVSKNSGKIQIVDKFPNYEVNAQWLYIAVCMIGEKLVFVPNNSREIVSYDMSSGKFTSVALDLDIVGETGGYFLSAFAYKNYVYMFPAWTKYIVRFDSLNNSIKYFDLGLSTALKCLPKVTVCFIKEFEVIENKIYIPFAMLNAIAVFDLEREQLEIKFINIIDGCSTINYTNGYFYLASCKKYQIYRWHEKTGEIVVYDDFPDGFVSNKYVFSSSYSCGKKVFFMPLESNMVISLDLRTKKVYCERKIINVNKEPWNTYFVKKENGKIIAMTVDTSMLCSLEYNNKKLEYIPYCVWDDLLNSQKIFNFFLKKRSSYILENNEENLKKYIIFLRDSNISINDIESKYYGKIVHEQIMNI